MSNHRELIKAIIAKLTGILGDLQDIETCSKCSRPANARGFCNKHYSQWRRQYCRDHEIRKLKDEPKVVEPDPRQSQLFVGTPPNAAADHWLRLDEIEF